MNHRKLVETAYNDGLLTESAKNNILNWLTKEHYQVLRADLNKLIENSEWQELNEAFYQVLPFGTGGRRGEVGVGSNRLNAATYAESAQGVANKLKKEISGRKPKVAIAYDTRLTSAEYTEITATVLAGNDIEVYLFDGPRPTPQLSFSIKDMKCDAGIVISASHNPPQDNGFKAYWSDGGQVVPPRDLELIEEVKAVDKVFSITFEEAYGRGLIHRLTDEHDARFYDAVISQSLSDKRDAKIVYSPIHGTGIKSIYPMLQKAGFGDLHLVESQKDPDGRFPNVPKHQPNPEVQTGLDASIALGQAIKADLVMASDPDADRLACAVSDNSGEFIKLTGNQCAAMMMEHICVKMTDANTLKPTHSVYSTCVSSPLMPSIARSYNLRVKNDLLVGFKWIAEQIENLKNPKDFLFGSEESIGYMKGEQTRDKDGAVAALLMSEMAAEQKAKGQNLLDMLDDIYKKYGYFSDAGTAIFLEGLEGKDRMNRIMTSLRTNPPKEIGSEQVFNIIDRDDGSIKNSDGELTGKVAGPTSNLLIFNLREDKKSWIAIRPSGTEPKIKFYFSMYAKVDGNLVDGNLVDGNLVDDNLKELKTSQKIKIEKLMEAITKMAMEIK